MLKRHRSTPNHRASRNVARWLAAPTAALALLGCPNEDLAPLTPCTVSGNVGDVPVTGVDKVDLLFIVDNSGSMAQEQAKLATQLPRLVEILTSGEREDGTMFQPAKDLHIGVVNSDMGLSGSKVTLTNCAGFGDDGKLLKGNEGCDANVSAGYLSYTPEADLDKIIEDFTCLAKVGTTGCGFEQQLEAMYKAVAPKSVQFAGKTSGHAHDDGANRGFLRDDAVLALVHVSDEEDCSITDKGQELFNETTTDKDLQAPSGKPLGLNIRCAYSSDPADRETAVEKAEFVYPVTRYIEELKNNVKPDNPDRIIFAGIVGIAVDTEGKSFDEMLDHSRMGFAVDPLTGNGGDVTNRNAAARDVCRKCTTASEADCFGKLANDPDLVTGAKPAVRFVKIAKGFGENGVITSICADSYAPAVDTIIDKISKQLSGACLPRKLNPDAMGIVQCDVVEILGPSAKSESACKPELGRTFREYRNLDGARRVVCEINQVPIQGGKPVANPDPLPGVKADAGWYYDDFSEKVLEECPADRQRRISFSEGAEPEDAILRFECFQPVVSSDENALGKGAVNSACTEDGQCKEREDGFYTLTCDDGEKRTNTCQISCGQDSECPQGWVCDINNTKFCLNPTCPVSGL